MPWRTLADAYAHTHQANTKAKGKKWVATANAVLERTGDDAQAVTIANAVVKKSGQK